MSKMPPLSAPCTKLLPEPLYEWGCSSPLLFLKTSMPFSPSDFISYRMGGSADFTADRERSLFSPATLLHFSGMLKFI